MAVVAAHVDVRSLQRKLRTAGVIECRRLPLSDVVTTVAVSNFLRLRKLPAVHFLMAVLALRRSGAEIYVNQFSFHRRWLVALATFHRPMRSQQRKLRLGMVELRQIFPRFRVVARHAAQRLSINSSLLHAVFELTFVNILMATGAKQRLPPE